MGASLVIGFVGLGNIGGPMARNMASKHAGDVIAFDMNDAAWTAALDGTQARRAASLADVAEADIVFLSLPGSAQVEAVCAGLAAGERRPSAIVDLSTTQVAVARAVHARLAESGIAFADAPVARTVEAARRGEKRACEVMDIFFSALARFSGDMALTYVARGGVYIGGGVLLKVLDLLDIAKFREDFAAKKPHERLVSTIPTVLITAKTPALTGCAAIAARG